MGNRDIVHKAVHKALENDYKIDSRLILEFRDSFEGEGMFHFRLKFGNGQRQVELSHNDIIFSHAFAKAFWGEKIMETGCLKRYKGLDEPAPWLEREYRFHLQQMALKVEPVKYLEKFL